MRHHVEPEVGSWYEDREYKRIFEVVALEVSNGEEFIEIQYYAGEIEEIDFDSWYELDLRKIPEAEDWTAPFDEISREDLGYSDEPLHPEDWVGPFRLNSDELSYR